MTFAVVYTAEPTRPSGGPQPGAIVLMNWTLAKWDAADGIDDVDPGNDGIYNPRDICGYLWPDWHCTGSQHAAGRAGDVRFPVVRPGGHPEGWKYARWLVANHAVLGIQEVIWAGQRWTNKTFTWKSYSGRSDHFDHVHWCLNAAAADDLTVAIIESVAPNSAPTPDPQPTPEPEDDDMPKPYLARLVVAEGAKPRPEVLLVSAARDSVHWVRTATARKGYQNQIRLDKGNPDVCIFNLFDEDANMASLAAMVVNLPFHGAMPAAYASVWKGPHFPGD